MVKIIYVQSYREIYTTFRDIAVLVSFRNFNYIFRECNSFIVRLLLKFGMETRGILKSRFEDVNSCVSYVLEFHLSCIYVFIHLFIYLLTLDNG